MKTTPCTKKSPRARRGDPDLLKDIRPELRARRPPEQIVMDMALDDLGEHYRRTGKTVGYTIQSRIIHTLRPANFSGKGGGQSLRNLHRG
jgi:hypothetical protein